MRIRINSWIVGRKFSRLRIAFLLTIVSATSFIIYSSRKSVKGMLELHKCPACFGISLCSQVAENSEADLSLDVWGSLGTVANLILTKNVFSAQFKKTKIIIKRLGNNNELQLLDKRICHSMGLDESCETEMKNIVNLVPNLREKVRNLLSGLPTRNEDHRLSLCPSTGHMDLLFTTALRGVHGTITQTLDNNIETANIWTTLQINPEPLILQIIRSEDGWPVPRYIGSCGRIIMTEHAGSSILDFYSKPWPVRAGLALQLLLAADRFTYSHPHFAFYLLDISPDNIAVNERGKLSFVDLEHIIVVDRHPLPADIPKFWNDSHSNEVPQDCHDCYVFSPDEICSHHISDHNHFVICQQLLAPHFKDRGALMPGGLLHSMPAQILKQYPHLLRFLRECSALKSHDRVRSARRLRDTLNIASKESPLFGEPHLLKTWNYF